MYLEKLSIFGWEKIEATLLTALAIKRPVLLIGECGTNKSEGARRIAESLGLRFCRYDASKAVFEDVIGFPNPQKLSNGRLDYVPTPLTIWDKEFVLIDEINRAPLQMQNKWFEVINERTLMGQPTKIKYVWSAMNPSSTDYMGTNELDKALVDRFALYIRIPDIYAMDGDAMVKIIKKGNDFMGTTILKQLFAKVNGTPIQHLPLQEKLVEFAKTIKYEHKKPISGRRLVLLNEVLEGITKLQKICPELKMDLSDVLGNTMYDLEPERVKQVWNVLFKGKVDVISLMSADLYGKLGFVLDESENLTKRSSALGWILDYLQGCAPEETYVYLRVLSTVKEESLRSIIWKTYSERSFQLTEEQLKKVKEIAIQVTKKLGYEVKYGQAWDILRKPDQISKIVVQAG